MIPSNLLTELLYYLYELFERDRIVGGLRISGITLRERFTLTLLPTLFDTLLIVNNAALNGAALKQHERFRMVGYIAPARAWQLAAVVFRTPVVRKFVRRAGIHIVFPIDGFDMLIESHFRVINNVKKLTLWADASG